MRRHHLSRASTWWLPPTSSLTQPAAPYIRGTLPQTPTSPPPWIPFRLQLRTSPLSPRQTLGMSLRLLLFPSRPRLSLRRLHPPWPRTSLRMPCDTPLSPLSPPVLTSLHSLPRPFSLVCRLPIHTPQTLTFQSTFGSSFGQHSRRPTCHRPWPPTSGTSSSPIKTYSHGRRLTLASVIYCSTT